MPTPEELTRKNIDASAGELRLESSEALGGTPRQMRAVNALMTATYWEIGRRIVEFEQQGARARRLWRTNSFQAFPRFDGAIRTWIQSTEPAEISSILPFPTGRKDLLDTVEQIDGWNWFDADSNELGEATIVQTLSAKSKMAKIRPTPSDISQAPSGKSSLFALSDLARAFPLPWSHYVLLISRTRSAEAFAFYHAEALRGGWSVRQLDRQVASQFYERTALSRNKNSMLRKGASARAEDSISADEEVRDPLVLEFLGLKDEYSETDLKQALLRHLENFLLELGGDFAFIGRQRRLRIGAEWYRVDLLFFHRKLRCLVVIDLKVGKFTHADAGQMHLYLNYAREHWTQADENPPVGLIPVRRER